MSKDLGAGRAFAKASEWSPVRCDGDPTVRYTDQDVHALLSREAQMFLAFLHRALIAASSKELLLTAPPKSVFTDENREGDFRVMPCVARWGGQIHKTVKIVGTNRVGRQLPDQITVGQAFVLHPAENFISHVFDACLLSSARTGACVAIAARALGTKHGIIRIVGCGRVGFYAAVFLGAIGVAKEFRLVDTVSERAEGTANAIEKATGVVARPDTVISHVDDALLVLATTAREPFCSPSAVTAPVVVSCGADADGQRELHSSWATSAHVHLDGEDARLIGDIAAWRDEGVQVVPATSDLITLVAEGPLRAQRPRVFVSTGSAILDNLTTAYILSTLPGAPARETEARSTHAHVAAS